ncbi:LysM peptidoglycan-binding domain-containing protein [Pararhizobium haloflavum]|uniref:LysM peptidoglycan-binding domain-containing protein n=1 Tax=Pararhizobium haloflavum TaxID=2037914 RepID=UPI001300153D|nr:LysM peptidoglycan-binding domain-containing protein [Pararhizobium haloflavum]
MNQGNAGLLALCILLGGIAFGVLFVAPRFMGANEATVETNERAATVPEETTEPASEAADVGPERTTQKQGRAAESDDGTGSEDDAVADVAQDEPGLTDLSQLAASGKTDRAGQPADGPAFDVLRVEPDGSAVIAGRADPGKRLDVMNGSDVIDSTKVGPSGDFAIVLKDRLAPGDYQLTLRVTGETGTSETSEEVATITIPADRGGDLLAMVTKPGEASRIVAAPDRSGGDAPAPAQAPGGSQGPAADERSLEGEQGEMPAQGDAPAPAGSQEGIQEDIASRVMADDDASPDEMAEPENDEAGAPEVAAAQTDADGEASASAAGSSGAASAADGNREAGVRIEAVEVEVDRLFVTGSAPTGGTVRVYANDALVGDDAVGEGGRFLVEGRVPLDVGEHDIRADFIDDGRVVARAIVPFHRPEGQSAAAVAALEDDAVLSLATPVDEPGEGERSEASSVPRSDDEGTPTTSASADDAAIVPADGEAEEARVAASPTTADRSAAEPREPDVSEPSANSVEEAVDSIETEVAVAPVGAESSDETTPEEPVTVQQEALQPTDASVIIRRGDTLWQISRRVYGQGVRYTTIYMANQEQIADPDRILPGQIFSVPDEALENAEELHRQRMLSDR